MEALKWIFSALVSMFLVALGIGAWLFSSVIAGILGVAAIIGLIAVGLKDYFFGDED